MYIQNVCSYRRETTQFHKLLVYSSICLTFEFSTAEAHMGAHMGHRFLQINGLTAKTFGGLGGFSGLGREYHLDILYVCLYVLVQLTILWGFTNL